MPTEDVYFLSHVTGSFTNPDNAVGQSPTTWAGELNSNSSATSTWAFVPPIGTPNASAYTATFSMLLKVGTNSGVPQISMSIYEGATLIASPVNLVSLTSAAYKVVFGSSLTGSFTMPAGLNHDNLRAQITCTAAGGSPNSRNSFQVAQMRLTVDTVEAPTGGSFVRRSNGAKARVRDHLGRSASARLYSGAKL